MNSKTAKIGNYYRLKDSPNYSWVKILEIRQPKKDWNTTSYVVAKCEHTVHKNDKIGFIKYFKLSDLIEARTEKNIVLKNC